MHPEWTALLDREEQHLWRGSVFRFPARYPFEDIVDFMLIADANSQSGFALVCTTGYHAGQCQGQLPAEALAPGDTQAISWSWLVAHWQSWVYPEAEVSKVLISLGYPPAIGGQQQD